MIGNTVGFTICFSLIVEDSEVVFYLIVCCLTLIWGCLIDAMPAHVRKLYSLAGPGFGVIFLSIIQLGLFFKLIPIDDFPVILGYINFTMSSQVTNFLGNTTLYGLRNVVNVLLRPNEMVVIKSPVVSEKVSKVVSIEEYLWQHSWTMTPHHFKICFVFD